MNKFKLSLLGCLIGATSPMLHTTSKKANSAPLAMCEAPNDTSKEKPKYAPIANRSPWAKLISRSTPYTMV